MSNQTKFCNSLEANYNIKKLKLIKKLCEKI